MDMVPDTSVVILAGQTSTQCDWKSKYNGRTLLEIAIERAQLVSNDIVVSYNHPIEKEQMQSILDTNLLQQISFIQDDTSLTTMTGTLRSLMTAITQIETEFLVVDSIDYTGLNGLDLMRLYQLVLDNPFEVVTFKKPDGTITSDLLTLDRKLTLKRIDILNDLENDNIFDFYRTSFNTAVLPILSESHRMGIHCTSAGSEKINIEFDNVIVIRPGKQYQAFLRLQDKQLFADEALVSLLEKEKAKWDDIEQILRIISNQIGQLNHS